MDADEERPTHFEWLTRTQYASIQSHLSKLRAEGTCEWVLSSPEFIFWRENEDVILLYKDGPGTGKSVLASFVVDKLAQHRQNPTSSGIIYIFFDYREQDDQTIKNLLAVMLRQLIETLPSFPLAAKDLYSRYRNRGSEIPTKYLSETLYAVASLFRKVFVVIDALDECSISSNFIQTLLEFQKACKANIFLTSRPSLHLSSEFGNKCTILPISNRAQDVMAALEREMEELPHVFRSDDELNARIKNEVLIAANGNFLISKLLIVSIQHSATKRQVRHYLDSLFTDSPALDKKYEETISRIKGMKPGLAKLAMRALGWIVYAKRPLSTIELEHALAVRHDSSRIDSGDMARIEDILSVCNGLLAISPSNNTIVLVHRSLEAYFARTKETHFPNENRTIAQLCIAYLSSERFERGFCETDEDYEHRLRENPLFDYASKYWGVHVQGEYGLAEGFLQRQGNVEACAQAMLITSPGMGLNYSQEPPRHMTGLHLAAYFGLFESAKYCAADVDSNPKDSHGRTPLTYAGQYGHETVFKMLLARNTEDLKQSTGWFTLKFAAMNGHEKIVRLLLENGTEPEYPNEFDEKSPVWYAAQNGHEAVVKQLIVAGADIETECDGYTPLGIAIINRHGEVVKAFQDSGANIETVTEVPISLGFAVWSGNVAMTALVLTRGVDVDSKSSEYGKSPLVLAVEKGHKAIVMLLLSKDAKLEPNDDGEPTPLMLAVINSHNEIVQALLQHDNANSETQLHDKGDALLKAANMKQWAIVQSLLGHGSYKGVEDRVFGAVLVPAVEYGQAEVISTWLQQPGCGDYMSDDSDRTLVSYAAEKGNLDIFNLVSRWLGGLTSADANGRAPISWAAACGHVDIVSIIFDNDEESIQSKDKRGRTPLAWAAIGGHEEVMALLLEKTTVVADQRDRDLRTPLSHAAEKGHKSVVQSLLRREDVNIGSTDRKGRNPLSWAAGCGRAEIAELILFRNPACINFQDKGKRTPLSWAAANGQYQVVKLLFELKADATAICTKQWNPLHYAAHSGHESVAKFIVTKMYNSGLTYAVAPNGTTALTLAVEGDHITLAKYLMKYDHVSLNAQITSNNHVMLQKLINLGCEIHTLGLDGLFPLVSAIRNHQNPEPCREVIDCLLQNNAGPVGIQAAEWRTVCKASDDEITMLAEKDQGMSISCERRSEFGIMRRQRNDFQKRLFMFDEGSDLAPILSISGSTDLEDNKLLTFIGTEKSGRVDVSVGIAFPCNIDVTSLYATGGRATGAFKMPPTRHFIVAWTVKRFLEADEGERWRTTDFASSLPDGWIPHNSEVFFHQFIAHLRSEWLSVCSEAEKHLSKMRTNIITTEKRSQDVMNCLLKDATLWIQLRSLLQDHVATLEAFCHDYERKAWGTGLIVDPINGFSQEIEDALSKLDKASESLIEIEFNLTSIAEALKSTSLSVSMKRLSWITFVFLPLTFVAGLFGMNVDVLQDNPAWWIYLPFAFSIMLLTIIVWLFFKRNTGMEGRIEKRMAWLLKP